MTSKVLEAALETANLAFDEHYAQWESLQQIPSPTLQDLEKWLSARKAANEAQNEFENKLRQIHGI